MQVKQPHPADMCACLRLGEVHLHPHPAVLHRKRPAHSNAEGQEERNAAVLQSPDRRAVRRDQNVKRGEPRRKRDAVD